MLWLGASPVTHINLKLTLSGNVSTVDFKFKPKGWATRKDIDDLTDRMLKQIQRDCHVIIDMVSVTETED